MAASPRSFGVIVEGTYDEPVYAELIRRICGGEPPTVVFRPTTGSIHVQKYTGLLRSLEHVILGNPVDRALIIRDSDQRDPAAVESKIRDGIRANFAFPGGIEVHAVRREMETWMLADDQAISRVAERSGGRVVPPVHETLEDIAHPKERFQKVLRSAGLLYLSTVCGEIARELDLATLRYRCPGFVTFERKVLRP